MPAKWGRLIDELGGASYMIGVPGRGGSRERVNVLPGLDDSEVLAVEAAFGFVFPPDLREFLQTALPHGPGFPDWRSGDASLLRERLAAPVEGLLFDVEHNSFWPGAWGSPPATIGDRLRLARDQVSSAPTLIPVFMHRMIPAEPHLPGNPVYSVMQTDIIVYGADLEDYFRREFDLPRAREPRGTARPIRFWSTVLDQGDP